MRTDPAPDASGADPHATTVAWPVELELDLVAPEDVPVLPGMSVLGSGKTARLRGRIVGRSDAGVKASLTFRSGLNAPLRLETAADGSFGPVDLYPGLAEVLVESAGTPGSVRELRLGGNQINDFNVSFGLPGVANGLVTDAEGKGIEGVEVELDGQQTLTDADGKFRFEHMTGGDNLLIILRKRGFATRMRRVGVAAARLTPVDALTFRMEPACELEIAILDRAGVGDRAQVVLLPANPDVERTYPWHRINPLQIVPGSSLRLEDLPSTRVAVRVYHNGAVAEPDVDVVYVRPGQLARHEVHMRAVAAGPDPAAPGDSSDARTRVKRVFGQLTDPSGNPVSNARVVLEVPDRAGVTNTYLGDPSGLGAIQREMIPQLGQVAQEARSDPTGRFAFTAWSFYAPTAHYLWAESADGKLRGVRTVRAAEQEVNLKLVPVGAGSAKLSLVFPGRSQGLPVVVTVEGQSLGQRVLGPEQALELEDLRRGRWRLAANWNAEALGGAGEFELPGDRSLELQLPSGAILGQDPDTLSRARGN